MMIACSSIARRSFSRARHRLRLLALILRLIPSTTSMAADTRHVSLGLRKTSHSNAGLLRERMSNVVVVAASVVLL